MNMFKAACYAIIAGLACTLADGVVGSETKGLLISAVPSLV